jgi:hypothetical protein
MMSIEGFGTAGEEVSARNHELGARRHESEGGAEDGKKGPGGRGVGGAEAAILKSQYVVTFIE